MIKKWKKKPVEIEALQWMGNNLNEVLEFCTSCFSYEKNNIKILAISTLEGNMQASIGDFIIKGIKGEFYPCKPDIFYLTYDEIENEN
jgi:hypothetical protein